MTSQEKYKIAFRLTSVASSGLDFIEESLRQVMNNGTDLAYLRSFYLLLSYNFELILKSRVVMLGNFSDTNDLKEGLQKLGHNIQAIEKTLGSKNLQEIDIKSISKIKSRYKIITVDSKEFMIENFTEVRYDFLDGIVRSVDVKEHERIKEYAERLFSVLRKAKDKNEEDKDRNK